MGDDAVFAAQQRRVTEQLGAAMLAAVGLMVRQYLGAPTGENEGQDSADAAWEDGAQAFRAGETVNESFDMARYLRLRQGASAEEPEESDHHVTYRFTFPETGRSFTLELHYRIVGIYQFSRANELVDEIFSASHLKPSFVELYGQTYPVLPPTENVFYMLHHMLKHYLYSGFGSRLLCDFTLYLERYASEVNFEKIHFWCRESKIFHLYELILESCRIYFGLSASIDPQVHCSASDCAIFLEKILADGDFGSDTQRKIVSSGSYQHTGIHAWFHEGHIQMKLRFPKLHKCVLLWPVLWVITFFCFLSNTYRIRHTTLRQTLADFRADNRKTKLLKIFDNNDLQ